MPAQLRQIAQLPLVAEREDANFIAADNESVKRHIARAPVRDHQLSQFRFHATADQRMGPEVVDRG